jgi:2-phospho-L-lactate guanylyltransferase
MAERVVAAAGSLPVVVVSSAPDVLDWSHGLGLPTLADPGGLDPAAAAGVDWCAAAGHRRAVIAHADLPFALPRGLERYAADGGTDVVTIVPCHRDDGSPVLTVPVHRPFPFAYGPGSLRRHARLATGLGLGVRIVRDRTLAFDLDVPEDLALLQLAEVR